MKIEEIYAIPTNGDGWRLLPNGNYLLIGANVSAPYGFDIASIGEGARIGAHRRRLTQDNRLRGYQPPWRMK
jgi:hypothetical protein